MFRPPLLATAMTLLVFSIAYGQARDAGKATDVPQSYTPATFRPEAGDRCELGSITGGTVAVSKDFFAYEDYAKALEARDKDGLLDLAKAGRLDYLEHGTKVLVIKNHDYGAASDHPSSSEVRILDGPSKGKTGWVVRSRIKQPVAFPLRVGEEGVLNGAIFQGRGVPIAANREAFNRFGEAWNGQDFAMIKGLEVTKQLANVPSGTRAKVKAICLDPRFRKDFGLDYFGVNVEFTTGPLKGKSAWIVPDTMAKLEVAARRR
jgi:hypothetical protein